MRLNHRIPQTLLILGTFMASINCFAGSTAQDWALITTPTQILDGGQSIGSYTSGCLRGAENLPLEGTGYQVMRLSRKRFYGHRSLIQVIQQLGQVARNQKLGTLLIGDLGQPRGGPTLSGHRSHQSGLDVDIWFLLSEQANSRLLTANERESWSATSVVDLQTDTINFRQWSMANERILEAAARLPEVDRIFVNPSIKRELCNHKAATSAEWLRKIRPWWKHDDHFHLRLKCPNNSPNCQGQDPLPAGDGCDASLAWWFSAEAKAPSKNPPQQPPPLPALCEQVLKE
jgi:penicillin-insensitive murein DD-endopeptidase